MLKIIINNKGHNPPAICGGCADYLFTDCFSFSCNMNIEAAVQINEESFNSISGTKLGSTQREDPFGEMKFHQRAKMFRKIIMWMVQTKAHWISLGMFSL